HVCRAQPFLVRTGIHAWVEGERVGTKRRYVDRADARLKRPAHVVVVERRGHIEHFDEGRDLSRIVDAPRAEVHLSRRCLLRHLDGTVLDAEIEAAALESLRSIQFELADIHRLRGVEDSALLSAEIPFVQDAVRIAARAARAVVGPGIAADRQIAAEIDPLRGPYGCADADRDLATAAWAGGQ